MNLSPSLRKLLLTVHVVTAVGVLGADLVLLTLAISGLNESAPETVYPAARLVGVSVVLPLAIAALVTGLLIALATGWGLFKYSWVGIKLIITVLLNIAVVAALVPLLTKAADAANGLAEPLTDGQKLPLVIAPAAAVALLVFNVFLGVAKPKWGKGASAGASRAASAPKAAAK
jgi:hypothetical protein